MKKLLITVIIGAATMSSAYCKPGGWFFDILDRSSFTVNSGYYVQPQYSYQQPMYYQQPRVIYYQERAPVYYRSSPVYHQQPYYNNPPYHYGRHCR